MRKLSEIQNEEALDVLADLLDPIAEISKDKEIRKPNIDEAGKPVPKSRLEIAQIAIKRHKHAVLKILSILDGVPLESYSVNLVQIPLKVYELLNDEDMMAFFQSQGLNLSDAFSGSATANTEEAEVK